MWKSCFKDSVTDRTNQHDPCHEPDRHQVGSGKRGKHKLCSKLHVEHEQTSCTNSRKRSQKSVMLFLTTTQSHWLTQVVEASSTELTRDSLRTHSVKDGKSYHPNFLKAARQLRHMAVGGAFCAHLHQLLLDRFFCKANDLRHHAEGGTLRPLRDARREPCEKPSMGQPQSGPPRVGGCRARLRTRISSK